MTKKTTAVFTVCNIAYLPKALVLAESLLQQDGRRLNIYLFDRKQKFDYPTEIANVVWIEDIGVPLLHELAFIYDIIEFSTSLKPFIALRLLETNESVIFLDPDTFVFTSLLPIDEELMQHPVVLTPHYTTPQPGTPSESDLGMMRFGSFNLGFFAVNHSIEAKEFLKWWSDRCIAYSFMESQFGLSTDQKWVAIAPCLFKGIYISFNLGYNVAAWNTFERSLSRDSDNTLTVNDSYPLVFFHFSNFDINDLQYLNKRASCEVGVQYPVLLEIATEYAKLLDSMSKRVEKIPYSFDYMSDGSYISPTCRRAYASVRSELPVGHDPFNSDGVVGTFAARNHLLTKSSNRYSYPGLRNIKKHSTKLDFVHKAMRIVLHLVGPNRFYDLSKLMVFLSMYRLNRGLWKL